MEVFSGYLTVKVPSILKNKSYNNYWCILYSGRGSLSPRVDLHQDKDNLSHLTCKKTIYIEEAKWGPVPPDSPYPAFSIDVKHNKHYIFFCQSGVKLKAWLQHLCCISKDLFDSWGLIGLDETGAMNDYIVQGGERFVVQPNVLYGSPRDACTFVVIADDSEGCHKLGLKGLYKLCVVDKLVQLLSHETDREITCWSLHELRNFGHSHRTFFINAGSRCKTGEGKFIFHTSQGETIVGHLTDAAERIRQAEKAAGLQSSASKLPPVALPKPKLLVDSTGSREKETYENVGQHTLNHEESADEQHLFMTGSPSSPSTSSDWKSSKDSKKEKKKKEEEEKKERKRKEEEDKKEKKKRDMEEKKKEKDKKKSARKSLKGKPSQEGQENPPVTQTPLGDEYARADDDNSDVNKVIYSEPWGNLPIKPLKPMVQGKAEGAVYAQPQRRNGAKVPALEHRNIVHTENYTPVSSNSLAQQTPPPIIPPITNWVEDDSNNNLYEHFNHSSAKPAAHENVYGIESASAPITVPAEENLYEDTGETAVYERVG